MRNKTQKLKDFVTFPLRAVSLFEKDKWGFSSLASERFDYVKSEVVGYCLDVGCGRNNRFIREYLDNNGRGIDVYPYAGLTKENLVKDISHFPFNNASFDSITFIASLNHAPRPLRDKELAESHRCLKKDGNIIITMGNPLAEIAIHKIVFLYDKIFKTKHDVDSERGMDKEEDYYLTDKEIKGRLEKAGFKKIRKKYFLTQWGLNHIFVAWKT
jgi:SAM-dependent methyltransferase